MKPRLGVGAWLTLAALMAFLAYASSFAVLVVDATSGTYWVSETLQKRFPESYDGIVATADFVYAPLMPIASRLGFTY